jgi:hypothetical protein
MNIEVNMNEKLNLLAEEINTEWCYYLDIDPSGDIAGLDVYIFFFKRIEWFNDSKKVKPSADDIMKYRIIFPIDDNIHPPNSDWDDIFVQGCMISSSNPDDLRIILDSWGFIDILKIKDLSAEERRHLEM